MLWHLNFYDLYKNSPHVLQHISYSFITENLSYDSLSSHKYYSERVHTPRSSLERNASWEADKESTYSASRMNACKKEKI